MTWRTSTWGIGLRIKGDWDGASAEYHEAVRLNPKNEQAHLNWRVL